MRRALAASALSAGEAVDDDGEEADDSVDDGLNTSRDGVDNGHDAVADGAENRLDLWYCQYTVLLDIGGSDGTYAGYNGAHGCGCVWFVVCEGGVAVCVYVEGCVFVCGCFAGRRKGELRNVLRKNNAAPDLYLIANQNQRLRFPMTSACNHPLQPLHCPAHSHPNPCSCTNPIPSLI